jgi:hypothetical protein
MNSKSNRLVNVLLENWEPDQEDIQFVAQLIRTVKDGGVWGVPQNGQVYRFNHRDKTITLIKGRVDFITHRTRVIAAKLGWRVVIAPPENPPDAGHITVTEGNPS